MTTPKEEKPVKKRLSYPAMIFMILLVLGLTLPFHCVLDTFHIFPKDNLTMKNTFITLSEIDSMVSRYNKASLSEKEDIKKEPLFKKLMEEGLIGEVQDSTKNHH